MKIALVGDNIAHLNELKHSIYCFMHKRYDPRYVSNMQSGGAFTVSNVTNEIQAIYDTYDDKRPIEWLKQFKLPLETVKNLKLPKEWFNK